jgi:hypothetical protein
VYKYRAQACSNARSKPWPHNGQIKIDTHSLGITLGIRRKGRGKPADNMGTTRGPIVEALGTATRHHGDEPVDKLGTPWGRPGDGPGRFPPRRLAPAPARENLRKTRGQPGDDVRMTCGDEIAVPSAARGVHRRCTAPVDRDPRPHLRERGLSTLSTAPITGTALVLYPRKDPTQVRAWGQRAPSARAEAGPPHPCPTPAGGGSP